MKDCSNCSNNTWGDGVRPFQTVCIRCRYVEEDGVKVPSNWNPKPMTNADRIRAMSDEELAKYFSGMICDINEGVEYHENPNTWLEWLRQPAEEVQSNA